MAKGNSKSPTIPQPQQIPLAKIHDLPGVIVGKQPDKSYGGLVTSIQAGGVKEPVVVRQVENGEYQLVTGYRRRRASELAKKQDIPALVYEMSIQEAQDYHHRVKNNPDMAIPGRPVPAPDKEQKADLKGPEKPTPAADGKDKGKPAQDNQVPGAAQGKDQPTTPEKGAAPAPAADGKNKGKPAQDSKAPGAA